MIGDAHRHPLLQHALMVGQGIYKVTARVSMRLHCDSVSFMEGSNGMPGTLNPCDITFSGGPQLDGTPTLLDFWRWAFSDICDDDIKGIFAEWMVGTLLGLSVTSGRRISWANSDWILPNGKRIEVKATAVWQSWKILNQDGSCKTPSERAVQDRNIRFCGLQARGNSSQWKGNREFKADFYVFCFQAEKDPCVWDAWNLAQWEFYMMTREELLARHVGRSISLTTLQAVRPAMSAEEFQSFAKSRIEIGGGD